MPLKPPSESTQSSNSPDNQLAAAFHGLSISNPTTPAVPKPSLNFIGGFNLGGASASSPALRSPSRPPAMPVPHLPLPRKQSLTMQYASDPNYPPRPEYDEYINVFLQPSAPQRPSRPYSSASPPRSNATAGLSPPASPMKINNTLTPGSISSSHSATSTPSRKAGQVRCAGITKAGKRCTRQVKADLTSDDTEDEEEGVSRFCYQHKDEVLSPSGFYSRKTGTWVLFEGNNDPQYMSISSDSRIC
jgi:hypothetical protein